MASTWRVNNSTALGGEVCAPWQADHTYATGARCVCTVAYATTTARAFVYEVTSGGGGKSHATTQPTWPTTVGNTVVDNAITWTCRSPSDGSWDNASCYLYYVTNHAAAAGDTIYIDDGHSEAGIGATMTLTMSATVGSPTKVYCVDKASDALSTGAVVATGNQELRMSGFTYSYGVNYSSGSGMIVFGRGVNTAWTLEGNNTTVLTCTSGNGISAYSTGYAAFLTLINAKAYIGARGFDAGNFGLLRWKGGAVDTGGSGSTCFYRIGTNNATAIFEDVDLSDLGKGASEAYLFYMYYHTGISVQFLRCKLPDDAGFVISQDDADYYNSGKVILHHCSSANQTYDFYERSYEGTCQDETTIVRTGGASDGTTAISCKMVSSSRCVDNLIALESPPITAWTSSTTEKTFTIEFVHDSATALQNDEIWMELEYPANNTDGLGAIAKSKCAILGTPADTTDSYETWTTTGLSNPNTRKLSVTVTPGKAGPICARVYLAKASTTVYVDPMITES